MDLSNIAIWAGDLAEHLTPKLLCCQAGAFRHRFEFCPYDRWVNFGAVSCLRRKAAVASGDHIFSADKFGVARDAFSDELRMLDDIARVGDDSRDQHFAFRQFTVSQTWYSCS